MKESGGLSSKRGSVIISYHIEAVAISASQPPDQQHFSGPLAEALSLTPPSLRHNTSPFGLLILATPACYKFKPHAPLTPFTYSKHSIIFKFPRLFSGTLHTTALDVKDFGSIEGVIFLIHMN